MQAFVIRSKALFFVPHTVEKEGMLTTIIKHGYSNYFKESRLKVIQIFLVLFMHNQFQY